MADTVRYTLDHPEEDGDLTCLLEQSHITQDSDALQAVAHAETITRQLEPFLQSVARAYEAVPHDLVRARLSLQLPSPTSPQAWHTIRMLHMLHML